MLASDPSSRRRRAAILLTVLAILAALVPLAPAAALPPQRALASQHEVSPAQAVPMNGTSAAASRRHGLARTPGRPPAPHGPRVSGGGPAASGGGPPVDPPLATFGSGTGVSVANGFPGYADAQYGCFADPCEWPNSVAAVNNQGVVQATDIDLRISTPNGILLADADLRSFLGMPAGDAFIGDMQVVYDADNTRWLLSGRGGSCDTGRVYLAVSGGADPLAPWTIYMWSYAGEVVDHPRIGESGSGIYTVAYNLWAWSSCTFGAFQGAELLLADAADARAGNALTASFETVGNLFDPVPSVGGSRLEVAAQSLGSDPADVDLFAITGTPATHAIVDETLLSAVAGGSTWPAAPLPSGFPAPGADLSSGPTHLVVDGNELLIAGNIGCTPAGSGTVRDCVRAMRITRTSGSATLDDDLVVGEAGFDEFGPTIVGTGDIGLTFVRSSGAGMSWVTSWRGTGQRAGEFHVPAVLLTRPAYTDAIWSYLPSGAPTAAGVGWTAQPMPAADPIRSQGRWTSHVARIAFGAGDPPAGTIAVQSGLSVSPGAIRAAAVATAGAGAVTVRISASSDTTDGVLSTNPHDDVLGSGIAYDLDSVAAVGTRTIYYQFGDGADTWSAVQTTTVNTPGPITAGRLAGPDRYATAVAISKAAFFGAGSDASAPMPQQPGVPVAVVATGLNFPDALAGGGAAGRLGGPVLLVGSTVPASVSAEIARLRPQRIIVLGGTSVVSTGVFSQLDALAPAGAIRIGGTNRYATAAAASNELFAPESRLGNGTVFVATGLNYPDALAGAPLAGYWKAPVLTVAPTALPAVTSTEIQRLAPTVVIILGGTASVSSSVEGQLRALVPSVTRIAGGDRYATAAAVVARLESGPTATFVATGLNYPDALAGGAVAYGRAGWPILLAKPTSIPAPTQTQLSRLASRRIWVLGGTGVISDAVKSALGAYATGP